ncbi:MAG TPA: PAS domain-containing protein, partial [Candidatus Brocadiia bacterium]|nr:PAS domain-containing protein [Candidatus Brocadiia bacterium]
MTETQDGFWNEERLRTLLRILPDGIFTVDMSGRVTSWNPAMERMTGIAASEAIGRPCSQLACEQCPGGPPHCGVFQMGAVEAAECTLRRADGSVVHVLKNACVMRDEQGQPIAALEALTDVTSLKVARD